VNETATMASDDGGDEDSLSGEVYTTASETPAFDNAQSEEATARDEFARRLMVQAELLRRQAALIASALDAVNAMLVMNGPIATGPAHSSPLSQPAVPSKPTALNSALPEEQSAKEVTQGTVPLRELTTATSACNPLPRAQWTPPRTAPEATALSLALEAEEAVVEDVFEKINLKLQASIDNNDYDYYEHLMRPTPTGAMDDAQGNSPPPRTAPEATPLSLALEAEAKAKAEYEKILFRVCVSRHVDDDDDKIK
jgi:hypothetical protein